MFPDFWGWNRSVWPFQRKLLDRDNVVVELFISMYKVVLNVELVVEIFVAVLFCGYVYFIENVDEIQKYDRFNFLSVWMKTI